MDMMHTVYQTGTPNADPGVSYKAIEFDWY